jgi:hypothetical protein
MKIIGLPWPFTSTVNNCCAWACHANANKKTSKDLDFITFWFCFFGMNGAIAVVMFLIDYLHGYNDEL